jgi:hypothetical protein
MSIGESSIDPYFSCHNAGTEGYKYKQYNSDVNRVVCCDAGDIGITALAKSLSAPTSYTTNTGFLTAVEANTRNLCAYAQYDIASSTTFQANYSGLYQNSMTQMDLFNILYSDPTLTPAQLVPTYTENGTVYTVDCNIASTATGTPYIPHLLEADLPYKSENEFAQFCASSDRMNNIKSSLSSQTFSSNISQVELKTGGICNTSSCITESKPYMGYNYHPAYVYSNYVTPAAKKSNQLGFIIGLSVAGVIIFGLIVWLVLIYTEKNKNRMPRNRF